MAARWNLVKSFLREATEDDNFAPVADIATAYAKLRQIQRGVYTMSTAESGLVQISSRIGETEFSFSMPEGLSPAEIMETAETALGVLENAGSIAEARKVLRRVKTTTPDFSRLRL